VWLRSDGQIRIGEDAPISDYEIGPPLAVPGMTLYRVSAAEAAGDDGTGDQKDYVLLDVISLMYMTGVNQYYFDCAIPVGGGDRRLVHRECPLDAQPVMYLVRPDPGAADASPVTQAISYKSGGTPHLRNPGIPTGVSSKARLAYRINALNIPAGGGSVSVEIGYNSSRQLGPSVNGIFPDPWASGGSGSLPCIPYFKRSIQNPDAANTMDWNDHGEIEVVTDYGPTGTCWTQLYGSGATTCFFAVYLLGFSWDRNAGVQSLKA
jgi:hypothetical protein